MSVKHNEVEQSKRKPRSRVPKEGKKLAKKKKISANKTLQKHKEDENLKINMISKSPMNESKAKHLKKARSKIIRNDDKALQPERKSRSKVPKKGQKSNQPKRTSTSKTPQEGQGMEQSEEPKKAKRGKLQKKDYREMLQGDQEMEPSEEPLKPKRGRPLKRDGQLVPKEDQEMEISEEPKKIKRGRP